jgi:hypothetical protein
MISPTDLFHPPPAPNFKTFQLFLVYCPKFQAKFQQHIKSPLTYNNTLKIPYMEQYNTSFRYNNTIEIASCGNLQELFTGAIYRCYLQELFTGAIYRSYLHRSTGKMDMET